MKQIPLTKGKFARVDDADYAELIKHSWRAAKPNGIWYAYRSIQRSKTLPGQATITMHQQIMGTVRMGHSKQIDHIDHDGLNNQRENLRVCTHTQNLANSRKRKGKTSSRFKGVHWATAKQLWRSRLIVNGKSHHLGYFTSETDAGEAYKQAALKHFGEFANPIA